jgi:hypothetical protein
MTNDDSTLARLHQAMHRLPGVPDHDKADERNTNRSGRVRAVRWNTKVNRAAGDRAERWNTDVNAAGAIAAARLNSNAAAARAHAKPPRVFVGFQEFIARRVG